MRIFLDQDAPHGIRRYLKKHHREHEVVTAAHQRWDTLENGVLLKLVEAAVEMATPGSYTFIKMPLPPKRPYIRLDE